MANWADRILAVVNTFVGRPSPTDTSAAFQVRAATVNQNFQGSLLAVAFCQALGTECTDNTSTAILCKLKLLPGRFVAGDRVTIIEDRPTGRVWCAVCTAEPVTDIPLVEFADADLQDATLAGTADYDTIKDDLLIIETAPLDKFVWPKQAILVGGEHGLSGTVIPWQYGNTQTIEAKLLAAVGPAGADTEVQFNDGGNMGADSGFTYQKATESVYIGSSNVNLGTKTLIVGQNHTSASDREIIAGDGNEVDAGSDDGIVIGTGNLVKPGSQAVCIFGENNVIESGLFGVLATGREARGAVSYARYHAGGKIAAVGDNQFGRVPAGIQTTDAAAHIALAFPLASGTAYTCRGLVTARTAAGVVKGWKFEGVAENTAGTSRVVAAVTATAIAGDAGAAAWVVTIAANDGTDTLDITVQDPGGATINWGIVLEWEEVTL